MERSPVLPWQQTHYPLSWTLSADRARKMSSPGVDGDPKPPCLPRNGLVKLPGQPNGLGTASITKGTPAAKNRPCQPPPPTLPPPSLAAPPPRAALAGGLCPQAGLPLGGPALAPVPGPPVERPPLATDEKILNGLFWYFSACERCVLAQVCKAWRRVLYQPKFWAGLTPVLHAKELYTVLPGGEKEFVNLQGFAARGFEGFCLVGVSDLDICEFIDNYALSKKGVKAMSLKRSTITDAGLEVMLEQMQGVVRLELSGCNDFTEAGLWSSLSARITSLSVSDCINVADDAIAAISQLLPNLAELSLQAYHVTDTALAYFTARQGHSTHTLRLLSCWEITNHGVVNVVHSLPNLTALSLSGCSKVTDDGVELVAENLRKLRSLDLSWCPRITDMALEYVACDLHRLEELVLDRCVRITDTGLSYLSTMSSLRSLYLRWCCQVQDFGLKHLLAMRSLRLLSLAGCPLLTATGLSGLVQLQELEELELTNCPGATPELFKYFSQHLPRCLVVE
ncbi:F-box/LRR-repeat protein 16 isoform X2 [Monodon monoceros]|uniref:F-box/LRR-repeat protein 16 n=6 Tax=Cetacea TaxID=9721 RepID=A0A8C6F150_MONMO|nr:F-box/LRR-repeat protein 16 isoform X2 [Monodon monoceros]